MASFLTRQLRNTLSNSVIQERISPSTLFPSPNICWEKSWAWFQLSVGWLELLKVRIQKLSVELRLHKSRFVLKRLGRSSEMMESSTFCLWMERKMLLVRLSTCNFRFIASSSQVGWTHILSTFPTFHSLAHCFSLHLRIPSLAAGFAFFHPFVSPFSNSFHLCVRRSCQHLTPSSQVEEDDSNPEN